jgi:hypothetical protein
MYFKLPFNGTLNLAAVAGGLSAAAALGLAPGQLSPANLAGLEGLAGALPSYAPPAAALTPPPVPGAVSAADLGAMALNPSTPAAVPPGAVGLDELNRVFNPFGG